MWDLNDINTFWNTTKHFLITFQVAFWVNEFFLTFCLLRSFSWQAQLWKAEWFIKQVSLPYLNHVDSLGRPSQWRLCLTRGSQLGACSRSWHANFEPESQTLRCRYPNNQNVRCIILEICHVYSAHPVGVDPQAGRYAGCSQNDSPATAGLSLADELKCKQYQRLFQCLIVYNISLVMIYLSSIK